MSLQTRQHRGHYKPNDAAQGDVASSLADFDAAHEADASLRPYLWQRGISAYYAGVGAPALSHCSRSGLCINNQVLVSLRQQGESLFRAC